MKTVLICNSRKKKFASDNIQQNLSDSSIAVVICIAFNVYKRESRIQKRKRNTTNTKRKKKSLYKLFQRIGEKGTFLNLV